MTSPAPGEVAAGWRAALATTLFCVDYDGTVAPIVDDPETAVPLPGMTTALAVLDSASAGVLVVSGRPVEFLARMLPEGLALVGLYGLEGLDHGTRWEHPNGGVWREVMADVATYAKVSGPAGMRVELKDLSITLHYRGRPELAEAVAAFARTQADRAGLATRAARAAVELHPPIDTDKGTVIEGRVGDATGVVFAGDDLGDLAAFDALERLAATGLSTLKVAVASDEVPAELVARADWVADGPPDVLTFFRALVD